MSIFYQDEAPNPCKRYKCLVSALKDAFLAKCNSIRGKLPPSPPEEPAIDFELEDEIFVCAVISKYMESKSKRKSGNLGIDSFRWALFEDSILTPKAAAAVTMKTSESDGGGEAFMSVGSQLSAGSSYEDGAFVSAEACLSRCSSLSGIDLTLIARRSIILEFIHCEGWPFGLCRKALLLPPLPKSPADSWSWRKTTAKSVNING